MMDFVFKMMDFVLQMMDFVLTMMDFVIKNDEYRKVGVGVKQSSMARSVFSNKDNFCLKNENICIKTIGEAFLVLYCIYMPAIDRSLPDCRSTSEKNLLSVNR